MMELNFTLNGALRTVITPAGENAQRVLFNQCRMHSVRNSDDGFGFAGSDAILFNGKVINASLLIAAQLDGAQVRTAESLGSWNQLSLVQQAMVDVGVVQSGYNDPAAALIVTDLLDRHPNPSRDQIDDALSGLFHRDGGYQQFYQAIELASSRLKDPDYLCQIAPSFVTTCATSARAARKWMLPRWCRPNPATWRTGSARMRWSSRCCEAPIPMR